MDVRFCEGRDHSREAPMRAKDLDREVRALASAPGHVCFSLTEDLHGCRTFSFVWKALKTRAQADWQCAGSVPDSGKETDARRPGRKSVIPSRDHS